MGLETKELHELNEALRKRDEELNAWCEKASAELKDVGAMSRETHAALTSLSEQGSEMQERLLECEQKLARRGGESSQRPVSWGQSVVDSDAFRALAAGQSGRTGRIQVKAVTTTSTGDWVEPTRVPGVIAPPDRVLTVRDLIMPGRTSSNAVEYVRETGFTNSAAMVAEGDLKPESDLTFDVQTVPVRTLAHWIHATKQILDDAPQLASYIDGRLRYGLAYVEEMQLLLGDNTGQNLNGLIPQATAYDTALTLVGDTKIDIIRHAMLQVRLAEYRSSGIVLNPTDWETIELTKNSQDDYLFSNPRLAGVPQLWGLPIVETTAMPANTFLVGAYNMAAQVFDREDPMVEVSTEDRDNFVKNMVTIRGEERLAMAVYRPESFVNGTFPA